MLNPSNRPGSELSALHKLPFIPDTARGRGHQPLIFWMQPHAASAQSEASTQSHALKGRCQKSSGGCPASLPKQNCKTSRALNKSDAEPAEVQPSGPAELHPLPLRRGSPTSGHEPGLVRGRDPVASPCVQAHVGTVWEGCWKVPWLQSNTPGGHRLTRASRNPPPWQWGASSMVGASPFLGCIGACRHHS